MKKELNEREMELLRKVFADEFEYDDSIIYQAYDENDSVFNDYEDEMISLTQKGYIKVEKVFEGKFIFINNYSKDELKGLI